MVLWGLPDGPEKARWLTAAEKESIGKALREEGERALLGHDAGVMQALLSPKVWMVGLFFFCTLMMNYGYSFSAPAILAAVTGWSVAKVGYAVAAIGVLGALGMLLNGAHSDRSGERTLHAIVPCCVMSVGLLAGSLTSSGWVLFAARERSSSPITCCRGLDERADRIPGGARGGERDRGHEHDRACSQGLWGRTGWA